MSNEPSTKPSKKGSPVLGVLWWVLLVLAVYVLSIGPVSRCCNGRWSGSVMKFYAPLRILYVSCPPARDVFDWYFELWDTKP